jgi:hypothetical protein
MVHPVPRGAGPVGDLERVVADRVRQELAQPVAAAGGAELLGELEQRAAGKQAPADEAEGEPDDQRGHGDDRDVAEHLRGLAPAVRTACDEERQVGAERHDRPGGQRDERAPHRPRRAHDPRHQDRGRGGEQHPDDHLAKRGENRVRELPVRDVERVRRAIVLTAVPRTRRGIALREKRQRQVQHGHHADGGQRHHPLRRALQLPGGKRQQQEHQPELHEPAADAPDAVGHAVVRTCQQARGPQEARQDQQLGVAAARLALERVEADRHRSRYQRGVEQPDDGLVVADGRADRHDERRHRQGKRRDHDHPRGREPPRMLSRPDRSCHPHSPPKWGRVWRMAAPPARVCTCSACLLEPGGARPWLARGLPECSGPWP